MAKCIQLQLQQLQRRRSSRAAEEPRSGTRCSEAGEKNHCPRRYSVEAIQDAVAAWEESGGARKSAAAEDLAMPLSGN